MGLNQSGHRFAGSYRQHYWRVLAYFVRRGCDENTARDLTAETFSVAWRANGDASIELPWLYGVAGNVRRQHVRSEVRRRAVDALLRRQRQAEVDPSDPAEIVAVRVALAKLSASDREVLLLSEWEGLTPSEMATALSCSVNAATVRLHRARRRLKLLLQANGYPETSRRVEVYDT